jgi:hypothetical protein
VSLFKPSVKALNPLNRLDAIFVLAVDRIAKSPYLFNWSMSSAIGLFAACAEVSTRGGEWGWLQTQAMPRFGSCAAVLAASHLKGRALGPWIDRHDAVLRVDLSAPDTKVRDTPHWHTAQTGFFLFIFYTALALAWEGGSRHTHRSPHSFLTMPSSSSRCC